MSRIFIALPQYRAMPLHEEMKLAEHFGFKDWRPFGLHPMTTRSLFLLNKDKDFKDAHYAELNIQRGDGVERARSTLLGAWLREWRAGNKFDYYLCLDEDISFHPSAIQSMIDADKPIIGGAYTYRTTEGKKFGKPVSVYFPDEVPDENGIMKIRWLNGGFVFCKAEALFKMIEYYPELRYQNYEEEVDIKESYAFWLFMVHKVETGETILLSEDYAFSQRAMSAGIDIWLDAKIDLIHWAGKTGYRIGAKIGELNRDGVPGWMNDNELSWLSETAKQMDSFVEIGSWKGRSTKALLENCAGTVYAIDHFRGGSGLTEEIAKTEDIYTQFIKNVGHFKNLQVLRMSSEEGISQFNGKKVDAVFIDGDHSRKAVRKDIEMWLPKCRKLICGHDYQEVMYTVHELLGKVEVVESIWFKYL